MTKFFTKNNCDLQVSSSVFLKIQVVTGVFLLPRLLSVCSCYSGCYQCILVTQVVTSVFLFPPNVFVVKRERGFCQVFSIRTPVSCYRKYPLLPPHTQSISKHTLSQSYFTFLINPMYTTSSIKSINNIQISGTITQHTQNQSWMTLSSNVKNRLKICK